LIRFIDHLVVACSLGTLYVVRVTCCGHKRAGAIKASVFLSLSEEPGLFHEHDKACVIFEADIWINSGKTTFS